MFSFFSWFQKCNLFSDWTLQSRDMISYWPGRNFRNKSYGAWTNSKIVPTVLFWSKIFSTNPKISKNLVLEHFTHFVFISAQFRTHYDFGSLTLRWCTLEIIFCTEIMFWNAFNGFWIIKTLILEAWCKIWVIYDFFLVKKRHLSPVKSIFDGHKLVQ